MMPVMGHDVIMGYDTLLKIALTGILNGSRMAQATVKSL